VPSLEEVEEKRSNLFFDKLKETLEKGDFRRQDNLVDRLLEQGHSPTDIASALMHLLSPEKPASPDFDPAGPRSPGGGGAPRGRDTYYDAHPPVERGPGPRPSAPPPRSAGPDTRPPRSEKPARPPADLPMTRIALSLGREHNIQVGDILGVVAGAARLPREAIGFIKLNDDHSFVDVAADAAEPTVQALDGIKFKGKKLRAKLMPS
jgi:ATP-dependent RNA helicase DeaD